MSKLPYWKQLLDPRWQEKRLRILQRAEFCCECCGVKPEGEALAIHHKYYQRGLMAWEYADDALAAVCDDCHKQFEFYTRCFLDALPPAEMENLLPLALAVRRVLETGAGLEACVSAINAMAEEINNEISEATRPK